ncbi:hypothetical protein [Colwellia piezophila]|uniref:hypothetical protein n=1 Tax=Colwellia piezophila TaxID=211668 RepID=UPI00047818BF|nr:hypothetical protein [Colwellia piezophila]
MQKSSTMVNKNNSLNIQLVVVIAGFLLTSMGSWFIYTVEEKVIINEFTKDVDERAGSLYREVTANVE